MKQIFWGVVAAGVMAVIDHLMLPARVTDLSTVNLGVLVFTHAGMAITFWSDK